MLSTIYKCQDVQHTISAYERCGSEGVSYSETRWTLNKWILSLYVLTVVLFRRPSVAPLKAWASGPAVGVWMRAERPSRPQAPAPSARPEESRSSSAERKAHPGPPVPLRDANRYLVDPRSYTGVVKRGAFVWCVTSQTGSLQQVTVQLHAETCFSGAFISIHVYSYIFMCVHKYSNITRSINVCTHGWGIVV